MPHEITRHRHDTRRRQLTVREKSYLTPGMIRLVLEGPDLADFTSLAPDDHVKLILPGGGEKPDMRDYTPRRFDRKAGTLVLDFAVHDAGPATDWAIAAQPGDRIEVGGPRGSAVVTPDFDWWLLVGDETALPAIGRWLEELPVGAKAIVLGIVANQQEEQEFTSVASTYVRWIHRPLASADDPEPLLAVLRALDLPKGDGFIWVAAESHVARAVKDHVVNAMGHPREWVKAAGYWKKGAADNSEKNLD